MISYIDIYNEKLINLIEAKANWDDVSSEEDADYFHSGVFYELQDAKTEAASAFRDAVEEVMSDVEWERRDS